MISIYLVSLMLLQIIKASRWAFLIAGTKGYKNYRHQADVFHAYKVLILKGFDPKNIIVMAYNDIVHHARNPHKGKMYNRVFGRDVYEDVVIDYQKDDVGVKTIRHVMYGSTRGLKKTGSGKVLKPGPKDEVLIFISGHAGPHYIELIDEKFQGQDFRTLLRHLAKRCRSVLVMIDACYAGSLFEKYTNEIPKNVLAITSVNGEGLSYANYFDDDIKTYLGDEFATAIFENIEKIHPLYEPLKDLYEIARIETQLSGVSVYGQLKFLDLPASDFFGDVFYDDGRDSGFPIMEGKNSASNMLPIVSHPATDLDYHTYKRLYYSTKNDEYLKKLNSIKRMREKLNIVFKQINSTIDVLSLASHNVTYNDQKTMGCYYISVDYFSTTCAKPRIIPKIYAYLHILLHACENSVPNNIIMESIKKSCKLHHLNPSYVKNELGFLFLD